MKNLSFIALFVFMTIPTVSYAQDNDDWYTYPDPVRLICESWYQPNFCGYAMTTANPHIPMDIVWELDNIQVELLSPSSNLIRVTVIGGTSSDHAATLLYGESTAYGCGTSSSCAVYDATQWSHMNMSINYFGETYTISLFHGYQEVTDNQFSQMCIDGQGFSGCQLQ